MALTKLLLPVDRNGYNVKLGEASVSTKLEGGLSRYRLDKIGAAHTVSVQWVCQQKGYDYLMAFYRYVTKFGSVPFLIDLIINGKDVEEFTAYIVPGSFELRNQAGLSYTVGATLEVKPKTVSDVTDAATVTAGP